MSAIFVVVLSFCRVCGGSDQKSLSISFPALDLNSVPKRKVKGEGSFIAKTKHTNRISVKQI